jgi:pyrroloquinoline-quinone synthase
VERWLVLAQGMGLDRVAVQSEALALPASIFAADAYVQFVRERIVLEAVASSLTEMFSPQIISERVSGMLAHYDFVSPETLSYFKPRLTQAPRDVDFALSYCIHEAKTREEQDLVVKALEFKCSILWSMLDALYHAYVEPGHIPPGAWRPGA